MLRLAAGITLGLLFATAGAPAASQEPAPAGKLALRIAKQRGIRITDLNGRTLRTISLPRAIVGNLVFGRQGERLWFLTGRGRFDRKELWLHVVPTSGRSRGTSSRLQLLGTESSRLAISPTESRAAVTSVLGGCGSLAVVSRRGRTLRSISAPAHTGLADVSWSPGGRRLAYTQHDWGGDWCGKFSASASLVLAAAGGTGPDKTLFTQRSGLFEATAWAPDGVRLAFAPCDQRSLTCRLIVLNSRSGTRQVLARDIYPSLVVWAAGTGEVVTTRADPISGIWAFKSPSSRRLVGGPGDIEGASVDGSKLAIYHSGEGNRGVLDVASGSYVPFPQAVQRRLGPNSGYFLR